MKATLEELQEMCDKMNDIYGMDSGLLEVNENKDKLEVQFWRYRCPTLIAIFDKKIDSCGRCIK